MRLFRGIIILGCVSRSGMRGKRIYRTTRRDCVCRDYIIVAKLVSLTISGLWNSCHADRSASFSLTSSSYDMSSTLRIHVTLALILIFFLHLHALQRDELAFRFASTRDAFWLGCTDPSASLNIRGDKCVDEHGVGVLRSPVLFIIRSQCMYKFSSSWIRGQSFLGVYSLSLLF